jgi:hypothetical protein
MKSTQSSASSLRGIVNEKPVHESDLSDRNLLSVPAGTSKEEYEPDRLRNL